jgi:predicted P-loop ATPase
MTVASPPAIILPVESTPVLEAATMYAALGLPPIPVHGITRDGQCTCGSGCQARGKHPVGEQWQKRATLDLDDVRDRFRTHTGNIGIYLGMTGHVLLDADGQLGLDTAASWNLPPTLQAASGSGAGGHFLYELAEGQDKRQITDRKVAPGLDIKVRGQFVVAPSRHGSGGVYRWVNAVPPTVLPPWLFERIRKPVRSVPTPVRSDDPGDLERRARAYVAKMPPAISGSGGHTATFAVGRALAGFVHKGLPQSIAWALLVEYNARCEPPWTERELEHKFEDALKNARTVPSIPDRTRTSPSLRVVGASDPPTSSEPPSDPPSGEPDWLTELLWKENKSGAYKLKDLSENVVRILQLDPRWQGRLRFNLFSQDIECSGELPWDQYHRPSEPTKLWSDQDATRLHSWLCRQFHRFHFIPSVTDCERAVDVVSRGHAFHPVREYLDGLEWDGVSRLAHWPTTYLGAEDSEYHSTVGRWWLISACARIFDPGCKVDTVPILESDQQGRKKSTAIAVLAGEWFSDAEIDIQHKDASMLIQGCWMTELAEVDSLMRSEPSEAKRFFSRRVDKFRPPWGKRPIVVPRQGIFVGSTNLREYLWDPTGARRYMPIACGTIDVHALERDRDQLWAEAVSEYQDGRKWYVENEADREMMVEQQAARTSDDSWEALIAGYLMRQQRDRVSSAEILEHALRLATKDWGRSTQMRAGAVMRRLGWDRRRYRDGDTVTWGYFKPGVATVFPLGRNGIHE